MKLKLTKLFVTDYVVVGLYKFITFIYKSLKNPIALQGKQFIFD